MILNALVLQTAAVVADSVPQVGQVAQQPTEISISAWELAVKGGWIMIVLAAMSLIGIYIFIDRLLAINAASREDGNFMNSIRDFIHEGKLDAARALCRSKTPQFLE